MASEGQVLSPAWLRCSHSCIPFPLLTAGAFTGCNTLVNLHALQAQHGSPSAWVPSLTDQVPVHLVPGCQSGAASPFLLKGVIQSQAGHSTSGFTLSDAVWTCCPLLTTEAVLLGSDREHCGEAAPPGAWPYPYTQHIQMFFFLMKNNYFVEAKPEMP